MLPRSYCYALAALLVGGCSNVSPPDPSALPPLRQDVAIDAHCPPSEEWELATTLKPSPVPYTPLPVMYVEETRTGTWSWNDAAVSYAQLLKNLTLASSLNPKPVLLFNFAEGHDCGHLDAMRTAIAAAAACSRDGPCIQGSIDEYRTARNDAF